MSESKTIPVELRFDGRTHREYYCDITKRLDEYLAYDIPDGSAINYAMRTYIMDPEPTTDGKCTYYIPIRVPGATRGHLHVVYCDKVYKVFEVELYDETAISGVSKVGCYKPEVNNILKEFIDMQIDYGKYTSDHQHFNPHGNHIKFETYSSYPKEWIVKTMKKEN